MNETATQTAPTSIAERISFSGGHAQVYHVRCGRCGATITHDVACDALRMTCSSCNCRLTLPATIRASCPACGADNEYPHTLAGHSTTCKSCDQPLTLKPLVGKAPSHRHSPRRGQRARSQNEHTFAYGDGAERSLILLVAAIATLIFVVAVSVL